MPLDVIVQDINSNYAYVNYLNIRVMICKENNYINMTKVVNMFETRDGNKKELFQWFRNETSKDLISHLSEKLGPNTKTHYLVNTGEKEVRGTYCHELLVLPILSWCSPVNTYEFSKLISLHEDEINLSKAINTSSKVLYQSDESEWFANLQIVIPKVISQYPIQNYKIDGFHETDDRVLLFEYDENEHRGYDPLYELNRYKAILKIFMWTKKYICWFRFSGKREWSVERIKHAIDTYESVLVSQASILYFGFTNIKHNISDFIPAYNVIQM